MNSSIFVLSVREIGEAESTDEIVQICLDNWAHHSYYFTAIPVVACLLQYLDGSIRKPGLWLQANIVEPKRFMQDMKRMGIDVKVQDRNGNGR